MLKHYNKVLIGGIISAIISTQIEMVFADALHLATVTPATITPATVTPATVTPANVVPATITPDTITPATIVPANTTPSITTPTNTTPATITPARVTPGNTSSATSTTLKLPDTTATDAVVTKSRVPLPAGMIIKVHGTADDLKSNKKIHHLKEKSLFYAHDVIITKKDSNVALRFNDGSFVVLGAESALEIVEFHFTLPPKGKPYQGSPKDRAVIKLFQGNLKAKLGSLAIANKPRAFVILTPRGRLELSDPAKKPNIDLIYNNKIGLAVKAVGVLNNSKGQVSIAENLYGLVSAIIGSAPTTTNVAPMAFSDVVIVRTAGFYNSQIAEVNTLYSESIITEEEQAMVNEVSDSAADSNASSEEIAITNEEQGYDDGDSDEDDDSDDDSDDGDDASSDDTEDGSGDE